MLHVITATSQYVMVTSYAIASALEFAHEATALSHGSHGQMRGVLRLSYISGRQDTFMECTAMSMRPSSRASSISFVNRPLPPMSASGWFSTLSPVVLMMQISRAPSSRSSGKASCRQQML